MSDQSRESSVLPPIPENLDIVSRIEAATKIQLFLLTEKYAEAESQAAKNLVVADVLRLSEYIHKQSSNLVKIFEETAYHNASTDTERIAVDKQPMATKLSTEPIVLERKMNQHFAPSIQLQKKFDSPAQNLTISVERIASEDLVTPTKPRGEIKQPPSSGFDRLLTKLLSPKRLDGSSDSHLCNLHTSPAESYASNGDISSSISVQLYPQLSETPMRPQRVSQKGEKIQKKVNRVMNKQTTRTAKIPEEVDDTRVSFNMSRPVSPIPKLPSPIQSQSQSVIAPSIELIEHINNDGVENVVDTLSDIEVATHHGADLSEEGIASNDVDKKCFDDDDATAAAEGEVASSYDRDFSAGSNSDCGEVFDLLESVGEWDSLKPFVQSYEGNPDMRLSAIDAAFARDTRREAVSAFGTLTVDVSDLDTSDQLSAASEYSVSVNSSIGRGPSSGSTHLSQDVTDDAVLQYAKGDKLARVFGEEDNVIPQVSVANALRVSDSSGEGSLLGSRFVQPRELAEIRRDGGMAMLLSPSLSASAMAESFAVARLRLDGTKESEIQLHDMHGDEEGSSELLDAPLLSPDYQYQEDDSFAEAETLAAETETDPRDGSVQSVKEEEEEELDTETPSETSSAPILASDGSSDAIVSHNRGTAAVAVTGGRYAFVCSDTSAFGEVEKSRKKVARPARKVVNRQRNGEANTYKPSSASDKVVAPVPVTKATSNDDARAPSPSPTITAGGASSFPVMSNQASKRVVISRQNSGTLFSPSESPAASTQAADSRPTTASVRSHSVPPQAVTGRRLELHSTSPFSGGGAATNLSGDTDSTPESYVLRVSQRVERRQGETPFADRYVSAHSRGDLDAISVNASVLEPESDCGVTETGDGAMATNIDDSQQQVSSVSAPSSSSLRLHTHNKAHTTPMTSGADCQQPPSTTATAQMSSPLPPPAPLMSTSKTPFTSNNNTTPTAPSGTTPSSVAGLWSHGAFVSPPGSWARVGKLPGQSHALTNKMDLRKSLSMAIKKPGKTVSNASAKAAVDTDTHQNVALK